MKCNFTKTFEMIKPKIFTWTDTFSKAFSFHKLQSKRKNKNRTNSVKEAHYHPTIHPALLIQSVVILAAWNKMKALSTQSCNITMISGVSLFVVQWGRLFLSDAYAFAQLHRHTHHSWWFILDAKLNTPGMSNLNCKSIMCFPQWLQHRSHP